LFIKDLDNDVSENDYVLLEPISSIATYSNEWWTINESEIYLPEPVGSINPGDSQYQTYVAPVVATDVGGAIVGAVVGATNSYIYNGKVTVGSVAVGAVSDAIVASTGIAGRIDR